MIQTLLFPNRTRTEVKSKFKLELRRRPWLIEHASENAQDILTAEGLDMNNMPANGMVGGRGWDLSDGTVKVLGDLKDKKHPLNERPPIPVEYVRKCLKKQYKQRLARKGRIVYDSEDEEAMKAENEADLGRVTQDEDETNAALGEQSREPTQAGSAGGGEKQCAELCVCGQK
jgi:hypothetical protein